MNSWEEEDVKRGREQEREGHTGHAKALFDDAHGSWDWDNSPAKKRDKVLVTKTKRSADPNAWTSSEDIKSKRVSEKRAGRMEKRGWHQHHRMGGAAAEGAAEAGAQFMENIHSGKPILTSPAKMSDDLSYGGSVIDQEPGALSHMGASKVLKHMKSRR